MIIGKEKLGECSMYHKYDVINPYKFTFYKHTGRYKVRYIDVDYMVVFG